MTPPADAPDASILDRAGEGLGDVAGLSDSGLVIGIARGSHDALVEAYSR